MQKYSTPFARKRRAYWTAIRVGLSYFWLNQKARIFGEAYKRRNIITLHQLNAQRVKRAVEDLQGLFIKFGQLVSILANVLPDEFRTPLESLQDKIPARTYEEVEANFVKQVGKKPLEIFDYFEKTPIAAASIGQVHKARIGMKSYAVKIQHADIEPIAKADLQILKRLVEINAWFMDIKGTDHLYGQIKEMIEEELDYAHEAEAMISIGERIKEQPELCVIVPEVYRELSTKKVLVSDFMEGEKISNKIFLEASEIDPTSISERLLLLFGHLILLDGFYHADPHPGNFLIQKDGTIVLLDFGAVATLSENLRTGLPELIEAILKNDNQETVAAMKKMGFIAPGDEAIRVAEELVQIGRSFIEEEIQMEGMDFSKIELKSGMAGIFSLLQKVDLRQISSSIQIPKEYVLLYRTIILLFGLSFELAPNHNPIDTIRPFAKKHLKGKELGIGKTLFSALKRQVTTLVGLPVAMETLLKKANKNQIEFKVNNLDKSIKAIYFLGQQLLFAVLTGFSWLMASEGRGEWLWYSTAVFAFLFLRAMWLGHRIVRAL